jgi:predicted Rossmann fold flavoprotein
MNFDTIVIGGGASGIFAAIFASQNNKKVLLIEKNKALGVKLKISGGGRCNILNAEFDEKKLLSNYGEASKYLYSPFAKFGIEETIKYFATIGIDIKIEDKKRAFPKTEKALDVFNALQKELIKNNVEIKSSAIVEKIIARNGKVDGVKILNDINIYTADKYILSTGGYSHPETGSTGDGFNFLKEHKIKIDEATPSLVPIAIRENWVKNLSGKTIENLKVTFSVDGAKRKVLKINAENKNRILFTHFGLSGPTILNNSKYISDLLHEGSVSMYLDLFGEKNEKEMDDLLLSVFDKNKNKILKNILNDIYAGNILEEIFLDKDSQLNQIDINREVNDIKKEERKIIAKVLKSLTVNVESLMGFDKAIIADGGVNISEVNFENMSLKKISNLHVTGDMLNISRPSGGYSLQLCWTTGYVAGSN